MCTSVCTVVTENENDGKEKGTRETNTYQNFFFSLLYAFWRCVKCEKRTNTRLRIFVAGGYMCCDVWCVQHTKKWVFDEKRKENRQQLHDVCQRVLEHTF